jgi:uncharacterized membrane protein YhaH (DUF805 family)
MRWYSWFFEALKKYFDFSGRARRKEYWYFVLVNILIFIVLAIADEIASMPKLEVTPSLSVGIISATYLLVMLCPWLAVTTRRLHDTNRSGWWHMVSLIPVLGILVIFVFTLEDSYPGENQYGHNPRGSGMFIFY